MVTVMDSQSKRTIYQDKQAHRSAPCSDISWTQGTRDTLVTVGYDCMMNVYDIRSRKAISCIKNPHPFSTVGTSACGNYCVAGNLKGDIYSYDLRNLKSALSSKRVHDGIVVRVAFIPAADGKNKSETSVGTCEISTETTEVTAATQMTSPANENRGRQDSFDEFLTMYPMRRATMNRRDSFLEMDFAAIRTQHVFDSSCESQNSISASNIDKSDKNSLRQSSNKCDATIDEELVARSPNVSRNKLCRQLTSADKECESSPLDRKFAINLRNADSEIIQKKIEPILSNVLRETIQHNVIVEEEKPSENKVFSQATSSDKENETVTISSDVGNFSKFANIKQSSPYQVRFENIAKPEGKTIPTAVCKSNCIEQINSIDTKLMNRMDELEKKMLNSITNNQRELLFNMWIMEDTSIRDIKQIVDVMIRRDEYLQDYLATKEENEKLKKEIAELRR